MHNETWRQDKLIDLLPVNVINIIQKVEFDERRKDCPYWLPEGTGAFTCKSAWDLLGRKRGGGVLSLVQRFGTKECLSSLFFMLRLLQHKIHTDEAVRRFGIVTVSRCSCCYNHEEETIDHLFSNSQVARSVWSFFCSSCGISFVPLQIRQNLMKWWMTKGNNSVHTVMLQCLPSLICWEIWKSRCAANFENIRLSARHIIYQVSNTITLIFNCQFPDLQLPHSWIDKCIVLEKKSPVIHSQIVCWKKPVSGYIKLNVDGCSKGNPGSAGGGRIIKDHHGDLVTE
ncbi:uncharacterized protein [Nicotiana sylvestris]|uniref:uncharacterized protein n=1 Tax=Nicotiana sylvestris TaxID=4096 RepID=UPI00388CBFD0